ncbi:MAG: IS1595 family transposase [Alphaproteobacteria bacterium]|nr:IS1595 family transposase [Alphaproteobacteria bacterium]
MKLYPANIMDLMGIFPTEESCLEYLSKVRWPEGYHCLRCGGTSYWKKARGLFYCHDCNHECSVTRGTLFHDTHKPVRLWFHAMWYVVNQKNGVSAAGLQRALGLGSYHTAWEWLHKLRRAMVRPDRDRLNGFVEINETFIGGEHSGKRGRGAEGKTLVLIAAEESPRGIGRIRLTPIVDASGETLKEATLTMVEPGSTIRTDGWDGYNLLTKHGYLHAPLTHARSALGDATPLTHHIAALLKRWWLGTHQGAISPKYLGYYLDEFTFRFNRRTSRSRGKLFYRLIEQALQIDPLPVKKLVINVQSRV